MTRNPALIVIAAGMAALFAAVTYFRPLMPVDETRYLSVAWEMMLQGNWILPTLNFEAYSHKPPMLFWLIRSMWEIFGVSLMPARIVSFAAMAALFTMTFKLARTMSGLRETGVMAALMLACMPPFLAYGSVIMFDTLMGVWVAAAMLVLWTIAQGGKPMLWFGYGAILGIGILTKGPVALVYMLPCALLVRVWMGSTPTGWWKGVCMAVLTAAMVGLAWALPAALAGGDAYAQKIFVTQSAGRMVNAFDHREPVWFYIPVLIGFLAPLLCVPALWKGIKSEIKNPDHGRKLRFIACWVIPAVLFFTAINSKQIHYMIPVLPGFAALAALMVPARMRLFAALAACSFAAVIGVHVVAGTKIFPKYDLAPIAAAIEPYKDRPLAAAPKYDGEYGYVMRMETPITSIGREDLEDWFAVNPDGVVIFRYKTDDQVAGYKVLFTQGFRREEKLSLIEKP